MAGLVPAICRGCVPRQMAGTVAGHDSMGGSQWELVQVMPLTWDQIFAHALSFQGTEAGTHFGTPSVKANGRALISPGREPGSFVLHTDASTKRLLLETDPGTYWQTPHYHAWPSLLVRYDTSDPQRVLGMVEQAYRLAMARKPPKTRSAKRR